MDKKYCIYKHTNIIDGKVYIGQTCRKPEYRWNNGKGYKQCPCFYNAIQKYGWDNFRHEILEQDLTFEEANSKQQYYIQLFKSNNSNFGYNLTTGGQGSHEINEIVHQKLKNHAKQLWQSPNYKEKMSDIMKEKWKDPSYRQKQTLARQAALDKMHQEGKTSFLTEQGRKKISDARKKYIAQHGTPTQCKGHSEETRKKLSEQKMGEKNPMYGTKWSEQRRQKARIQSSKKAQCIQTGQIFNSRKQAAEWCGLSSGSSIVANINGRKKSAGVHPGTGQKLHWKNVD